MRPVAEGVGGGALRRRGYAVRFWDGSVLPASDPGEPEAVTIAIHHPRALAHVAWEPNQLGLARAWVEGLVDAEGELEVVFQRAEAFDGLAVAPADRRALARLAWRLAGPRLLLPPRPHASEARPRGRLHSLRRDRAAVRHHYDLPAAFYRLFLGETMVYSCAYFDDLSQTLEEAQRRKLDLICRKLALRAGDRLLDVGCGWGSLVLHAAERFGVHAVGVTLSERQAQVANARVRKAGLGARCEIRVADYREVADGPYDAIASVGMYEHVGRAQLGVYAETMRRLLRDGGLFLNHGITRLGRSPRSDKRFIPRYVFPDGELHRLPDVMGALEAGGLEVRDVESLREHYALTLRAWGANLAARRLEAIRIAGAERERIWRLYIAASAHAFARGGEVSVVQIVAAKPGAPHRLPLDRQRLREDLSDPAGGPASPAPGQQVRSGAAAWPSVPVRRRA